MSGYKAIKLIEEEGIIILTIDRPKALNALNNDVFLDLIQAFTEDERVLGAKGVIITGTGDRAFAAGADISEFSELDEAGAMALSQRGQDIFHKIEHFHRPVIAAVNGFALGGGCELAMACHMRIAAENAKFGQPEVNLGILPGYGGTQRLVYLIGKGKAMELTLTGDMIAAEEAHRLGLANHVVPQEELLDKSKSIIAIIATKAPLAIAESIQVVNAALDQDKNGFAMEVAAFGRLAETEDFKEGSAAFLEKRKPSWSGK